MAKSVKATFMARQFTGRMSERLELLELQMKDGFAALEKLAAESAEKTKSLGKAWDGKGWVKG